MAFLRNVRIFLFRPTSSLSSRLEADERFLFLVFCAPCFVGIAFCILPGNNQRGFYVQLIEPAQNRFCIRCCVNNSDCPHTNDTKGCEVAIPGTYYLAFYAFVNGTRLSVRKP